MTLVVNEVDKMEGGGSFRKIVRGETLGTAKLLVLAFYGEFNNLHV